MAKIKHICEFCGKEYENYFKESKYCSKECYQNSRKENAKLANHICPNCGNTFNAHDSNTIYCSKKCANEAKSNKIVCVCENCGKKFKKAKYKVDKSTRHFCSESCKREAMFWSKEDEDILRKNYGKLSYKEISGLLHRNIKPHSIYRKACDMGIVESANVWSDEEVKVLIDNYSIKPMSEIIKLLPNRTQSAILGQARKYDLKSYFYINRRWSDDDVQYLIDNYIDKSYEEISNKLNRTITAIKVKMYTLDLHKPTEIVGYNNLYTYVRQRLVPWRNKVREEHDFTCELTGEKSNIIVHHIHGFNLLLEECIEMIDFPIYDNFSMYTQAQLDSFMDAFISLQEYYGAYVCISENAHKEFHRKYGYGNNTQEQWLEFVSNYK